MLLHYYGKTAKHGNPFFSNVVFCFAKRRIKHSFTIKLLFVERLAVSTSQDLENEHGTKQSITHVLNVYEVCRGIGRSVKNGSYYVVFHRDWNDS